MEPKGRGFEISHRSQFVRFSDSYSSPTNGPFIVSLSPRSMRTRTPAGRGAWADQGERQEASQEKDDAAYD
jgi:hypothetical protein